LEEKKEEDDSQGRGCEGSGLEEANPGRSKRKAWREKHRTKKRSGLSPLSLRKGKRAGSDTKEGVNKSLTLGGGYCSLIRGERYKENVDNPYTGGNSKEFITSSEKNKRLGKEGRGRLRYMPEGGAKGVLLKIDLNDLRRKKRGGEGPERGPMAPSCRKNRRINEKKDVFLKKHKEGSRREGECKDKCIQNLGENKVHFGKSP